jgi:hypothetical protein
MNKNDRVLLAVKCLIIAVKRFYCNDYEIFTEFENGIQGMERACAFRIGSYFREIIEDKEISSFYGYSVDMEYNRQGIEGDKKMLIRENQRKNIFPDLILHSRGEADNILVCEFKVQGDKNGDFNKLKAMTRQEKGCCDKHFFGYNLGIFIRLASSIEKREMFFFSNGVQVSKDVFFNKYGITEE